MSLSDLKYLGDLGIRLEIAVATLSGWLDLNSPVPDAAYPVDYYGGLLAVPNVTVRTEESGGIVSTSSDALAMDNAPRYDVDGGGNLIAGTAFGLFDAPLPFILRGQVVASWIGRQIAITPILWGPDGLPTSQNVSIVLRIEKIRKKGTTATLTLTGLQKSLMDKSVATVKSGSEWIRGVPTLTLMKQLVRRTDPTIPLHSTLDLALDFGSLSSRRASSWGPSPGFMETGFQCPYNWVARCSTYHESSPGYIWVGFEVPTNNANPDGAVARMNLTTGRWTIVLEPGGTTTTGCFPIALWMEGSLSIYTLMIQETDPLSTGTSPNPFYKVRTAYCNQAGGNPTFRGSWMQYWPQREVFRKGVNAQRLGCTVGTQGGYTWWYGEPITLPYSQAVECLVDRLRSGISIPQDGGMDNGILFWHSMRPQEARQDQYFTSDDKNYPHPWPQHKTGAFGQYILPTGITTTDPLATRYCLGPGSVAPPLFHTDGSNIPWSIWVAHSVQTNWIWEIYRQHAYAGTAVATYWNWCSGLGTATGSAQLWNRQVTAFSFRPGPVTGTGTTFDPNEWRYLLATLDWNDIQQREDLGGIPWSRCALWEVDCSSGTSGSEAVVTLKWSKTPSGTAAYQNAPVIVDLYTPQTPLGADQPGGPPRNFTVAVILNRGDVSGPSYGLGIWKRGTDGLSEGWICRYPDAANTSAPVSGLPFTGFSIDPNDSTAVLFVDQATGRLWKVSVNETSWTATFSVENAIQPIHTTEFCPTTRRAAVIGTTGKLVYTLGPGLDPWTTVPWYNRSGYASSELRRKPGIYPLVQLGTTIADSIELADLSLFENAWEAIRKLGQRVPDYQILFTTAGEFAFRQRRSSTVQSVLVPLALYGDADAGSDQVGYEEGFDWGPVSEDIVNAVDVTPWGPIAQAPPPPQTIITSGSTFQGKFLIDSSRAPRSSRILITAAGGGDILDRGNVAGKAAILFRYQRVPEKTHAYLAIACGSTDTAVIVSGLTIKGTRLLSGATEIRTGDYLKVSDSDYRTISSWSKYGTASSGSDATRIVVSPAIGIDGPIFSEVTIEPKSSATVSDDPAGITTLASTINSTQYTLPVTDSSQLRPGMILRIYNSGDTYFEYVRVSSVGSSTARIERGLYGTPAAAHASGAAVLAYIGIDQVGRLYEVGDSGFCFGISEDITEAETKARTIHPGDGVLAESAGMQMSKLEQSTIRVLDSASIALHGRKEKTISDNPFLDLLTAERVATSIVQNYAEPRISISNLQIPLLMTLEVGDTVQVRDPRITPGGSPEEFEVRSIVYRFRDGTMVLGLRAYEAFQGAGKRGTETEGAGAAALGGTQEDPKI